MSAIQILKCHAMTEVPEFNSSKIRNSEDEFDTGRSATAGANSAGLDGFKFEEEMISPSTQA